MIRVVHEFLPTPALRTLQRITETARGKGAVHGGLQDRRFMQPLLSEAAARFPGLAGLPVQQVLLRFEGNTGLLHHDLNHRPDRRFSLICYLTQPTDGGEIIFPFFDAAGQPTDNPVTAACRQLAAADQHYAEDPALEAWLTDHRGALLSITPRENTAVLVPCDHPSAWHFVCPVRSGQRACLVVFYRQPGALRAGR